MIGQLRGVLSTAMLDGSCILDVQGVGYEVHVPPRLLAQFPELTQSITLFVHTHVREDALTLYGFLSRDDRAAFRALLGVSSVGPKLAMAILNVLPAMKLHGAIGRRDKDAFRGIPGVGKKTVERLLLDLQDRLPLLSETIVQTSGKSAPPEAERELLQAVISALVHMGYKQSEAERAVAKIESLPGKSTEALLREALAALA